MKFSFLDHFEIVSPSLKNGLLGEQSSEALEKLCALFPYDIAHDFGFESQLGKPATDCDFFLQIRKGTTGAMMLAGKSPVSALSDQLLNDPFWQRVVRLFGAWSDPGHILSQTIEVFWLEFDYQGEEYNPIPNIFFRIEEVDKDDREVQWEKRRRVLNEIYGILFDIDFPDDLAENMRHCIGALPDRAGLYQIGFMIPRKMDAIRLILVRIRHDEIENYLTKIGWSGEMQIVKELVEDFSSHFDYFVYNLNVGKSIMPYLSIEMYFQNMHQPQFGPRWGRLLDFLESRHLVTDLKREALIRFCGKKICGKFFPRLYVSGINHLKIVYKKGSPIECKGYFGTMIRSPQQP